MPELLERCLARDWRVCIEGRSRDVMDALDRHLWTYREDSFLPHGLEGQAHDKDQPILLSTTPENRNGADVLMLVDHAEVSIERLAKFERVCVFFDGHNEDAVSKARVDWKAVKDAELEAKYWAQVDGRWQQKA